MPASTFWHVLPACIGAGIGAEAVRQMREYKTKRRATPSDVRNAGFWTDRKVFWSEFAVWTFLIGSCAYGIALVLMADWFGILLPV